MNAIQTDEKALKKLVNDFKVLLIKTRMRLGWHSPFNAYYTSEALFLKLLKDARTHVTNELSTWKEEGGGSVSGGGPVNSKTSILFLIKTLKMSPPKSFHPWRSTSKQVLHQKSSKSPNFKPKKGLRISPTLMYLSFSLGFAHGLDSLWSSVIFCNCQLCGRRSGLRLPSNRCLIIFCPQF